jgi:hypothetical protein
VREERVWFWGLQQAQVISIATLALALIALAWLLRRDVAPAAAAADLPAPAGGMPAGVD